MEFPTVGLDKQWTAGFYGYAQPSMKRLPWSHYAPSDVSVQGPASLLRSYDRGRAMYGIRRELEELNATLD